MAKAKRNPKTAYICGPCRLADKTKTTHPGLLHVAGICDCECRDA